MADEGGKEEKRGGIAWLGAGFTVFKNSLGPCLAASQSLKGERFCLHDVLQAFHVVLGLVCSLVGDQWTGNDLGGHIRLFFSCSAAQGLKCTERDKRDNTAAEAAYLLYFMA